MPIMRKEVSRTSLEKSQSSCAQNPLNILVRGLYCPICLRPIRKRSVMLDAIYL